MRYIIQMVLVALWLTGLAAPAAQADPGTPAERLTRASQLDPGHGALIMSIRSELYLDEPLTLYFVREGGDIASDADVVRFKRRQGFFAFGNDTTKHKVRAYQLPAGRYRLAAHGMDCPKVPAPEERCLIDRNIMGSKQTVARPSRGYGEKAPIIEVVAGALTNGGDFALTARNTVEWSRIPPEHWRSQAARFEKLPEAEIPYIPGEFMLKYALNARSYRDDAGRRY
ncbi:MAG: hypothetical protein AAF494_02275 [Pseudomonadota bacterium]